MLKRKTSDAVMSDNPRGRHTNDDDETTTVCLNTDKTGCFPINQQGIFGKIAEEASTSVHRKNAPI